jgi:hypothetical protein
MVLAWAPMVLAGTPLVLRRTQTVLTLFGLCVVAGSMLAGLIDIFANANPQPRIPNPSPPRCHTLFTPARRSGFG